MQTPADRAALSPGGTASPAALPPAAPGAIPAPTGHTMGQTGRGGGVVSTGKGRRDEKKRISSHTRAHCHPVGQTQRVRLRSCEC